MGFGNFIIINICQNTFNGLMVEECCLCQVEQYIKIEKGYNRSMLFRGSSFIFKNKNKDDNFWKGLQN